MVDSPPPCPQGSQYQGWLTRLYSTSSQGLLGQEAEGTL